MSKLTIRQATPQDAAAIMQFIIDLAVYEKAADQVMSSEQDILDTLFCESPKSFALIAEIDGTAVGYAVYFFSYSTWLGKYGIYLEDLYVSPERRGSGAGKALLRELAKIAVAKDCGRIEWSVLDWNEPAIQFYQALGAVANDGWTVYRLCDQALLDFAHE